MLNKNEEEGKRKLCWWRRNL